MRTIAVLAASLALGACASGPQTAQFKQYPTFQLDEERIAAVEANAINYSGKVIWVSAPMKRTDRN
jgi:hypothetical protein